MLYKTPIVPFSSEKWKKENPIACNPDTVEFNTSSLLANTESGWHVHLVIS